MNIDLAGIILIALIALGLLVELINSRRPAPRHTSARAAGGCDRRPQP